MSSEFFSDSIGLDRLSLEKRSQNYVANFASGTASRIDCPNAPPAKYHVVVPIFNEADLLERILNKIESLGYLNKVTFVNDASTDKSKAILGRWREEKRIDVIHLEENRKKEGAIREAIETLEREERLPEKVVLLDADSFMSSIQSGEEIDEAISQASAHMDENNFAAMGFRYDIYLPEKPSLLQRAQYAEFAGLRFMNRVAPKHNQLWVINGRGGIFKSRVLLPVLQEMEPDFETGDILITQKIMKAGHKIAYYDKIKVETMDVKTLRNFSKQRRRWARGTTKVMFNERGYYAKEISRFSKVGLMSMLYLFIDLGIPLSIISTMLLAGDPMDVLLYKLPTAMVTWTVISTGLAVSDRGIRDEGYAGKVMRWSLLNAFLYVGVTMPSRFAGLFDTIKYITLGKCKTRVVQSVDRDNQAIDESGSAEPMEADQGTSSSRQLKMDPISQTSR